MSLTPDQYLLHRIDASKLADNRAVQVTGRIEQRQCAPGLCQGLRTCNDIHCEGHPVNEVQPHERNAKATRRFWLAYLACVAAFLAAVIPNADALVGLFTR